MAMPIKVPVTVKGGNIPSMLVFVYLNEVNFMSRFEKIFIQQNTKKKKTLLISRREKKKKKN